ncbi:hypothetical protein A8E85_17760 [Burkholderia cenocepacia]|nr:hypothetical protein A8E85_17760 [Burkholderia cenocepacia]
MTPRVDAAGERAPARHRAAVISVQATRNAPTARRSPSACSSSDAAAAAAASLEEQADGLRRAVGAFRVA